MKTDSQNLHKQALLTYESAELLLTKHARLLQACYLLHVALECHIKAYLLTNFQGSIRNFQLSNPELYSKIFRSKDGHDLAKLLDVANLKRRLAAFGRANPCIGSAWGRVSNSERPYSLRYGFEPLNKAQAKEEIELGRAIASAIGEIP